MAIPLEVVMDDIRIEFKKLLEGSGVSWNKQGMLLVLEKAISKALAKHIDTY